MTRRSPSRAALTAALFSGAFAQCTVTFDPALYQPRANLADRCEVQSAVPAPPVALQQVVSVDTTRLADNYRDFAGCIGNDLPGNDGFLALTMHPGETWHFHLDPVMGVDPALYILPVCNEQQCSRASAADNCGPGRGEHFSFRPTTDGVYYLGVDSKQPGGALFALTVVHPVCGNGIIDHGEPCDDMRAQVGVECSRCHKVLSTAMATEEGVANDDYVNAMLLNPPGGFNNFTVVGTIAACDTDTFAFDTTAARTIRVAVAPRSGSTCPPNLSLALLRSDSVAAPALTQFPALVTDATTGSTGVCPSLSVPNAPAGTYFAQVAIRPEPSMNFAYQLSVDAP